jgi:hypothetical protein
MDEAAGKKYSLSIRLFVKGRAKARPILSDNNGSQSMMEKKREHKRPDDDMRQ